MLFLFIDYLPIVLRKGVWSYTKYHLSNFLSYDRLSPSYRAFASFLSYKSIPKNWMKAVENIKWKEAMVEEMRAL